MLPYVGNGGGSALHRLGMRKVALSRTPPPGARSRSGPKALAPASNGTHTAAAAVTTSRVAAWVQAVDAPPPTLIPRVPELDLSPARMQRPDTVDGAGSPGRKGTALLVPPTSASKLDPYGKLKYLQKLGAQRNGAADGHATPAVTPSPAATTADASYLLTPRRGRSLLLNAAQRESLMNDRPVDDVLSALLPAATSGALTPRRTATPQRPSVLTHETALPVATAKVESSQSQTATSRNGDNTQQTPLDVNASRKLDAQQTDGRERLHRDEAAARGALVSAFQLGCRERAAWRALFEVTGRSERQAMMAAEASLRSRIDREWYAAVRGLFTLLVFAESTALLGDFSAKIDAAVAAVTELVLEARRTAPTKTATVVSPVKHGDESQPLPAARSTSVEESPAAMSASEATESRRSATPRDADGSPTPSPSRKSYVAHEERITSLPSIAKEMKKAFAPVGGNNIGREVFTNHARRLVHPLLEAMTRAVLTDVVESAVRARLQPEQL